jgi:ABC-2 type transport system permease protein
MRGLGVFLLKELREVTRTWRLWVLPSILVVVGVIGPISALLAPALVESLAGSQPGVVIEIPEPTTVDAYLEFVGDLTQIVLIAVVIASAGMIAGEVRSGTAVLVLTKPLSRQAMVVAKVVSNSAIVAFSTALGATVCWALTNVVFDDSLAAEFARAVGVWLALALLFVALMALFSVVLRSQAGAAGAGLAAYLLLAIASGWGPAREFTPAGLVVAGNPLLTGGEVELLWPLLGAAAGVLALTALAAAVFARQEL